MAFQGFLRQSTAVDILLGPFLDETTGKDAEAGLTILRADVKLSKNGQGLAQKTEASQSQADGSDGYYNCVLDTTDTNTVGQLTLIVHESGALPVRLDYHIVEEAVYDAMYGGSAAGPLLAAGTLANVTTTATVSNDVTTDSASRTASKADVSALATGTNVTDAHSTTDGKIDTTDGLIGTAQSDLDKLTGTDGATLASAQGNYAPNKVVPDAAGTLASYDPPTKTEMDSAFTEIKGATWSSSTDTLEAIRDAGGGDATEAKQDIITTHLTDVKGTGFVKDTNSLVDLSSSADVNLTTESTIVRSE